MLKKLLLKFTKMSHWDAILGCYLDFTQLAENVVVAEMLGRHSWSAHMCKTILGPEMIVICNIYNGTNMLLKTIIN